MQNITLGHSRGYDEKEEALYTDDVMQPLRICTQKQSPLFSCSFPVFRVVCLA